MKNHWIPIALVAMSVTGIAAYFLLLKPSTATTTTTTDLTASTNAITLSGLPVLAIPPDNPPIGYTYINSTDRKVYYLIAANEWLTIQNPSDQVIATLVAFAQEPSIVIIDAGVVQTQANTAPPTNTNGANTGGDGTMINYTEPDVASPPPQVPQVYHVDIHLPIVDLGTYGTFYRPPIYKVINNTISINIYLGGSVTPIYTDPEIFASTLLIPKRINGSWTYIK